MYDPLALDRQRVEQDRLRSRAEASSRIPRRSTPAKRDGHRLFAAIAAFVPHPRSARDGCPEGSHALAPM
jgi:hypothetical protein